MTRLILNASQVLTLNPQRDEYPAGHIVVDDGQIERGIFERRASRRGDVHFDEHENDTAMRKHAQAQAKKVYDAVGAKRMITTRQTPGTHNMCTARMSKDPRDGVCDAHGQTHDIKNLFISDGSAMTTSTSAGGLMRP